MSQRLNNSSIRNVRMRTIAHLLRNQVIGSQEELQQMLLLQGIDTTQATLSRDLRDLQAEKRTMPDGSVRYVLPTAEPQTAKPSPLDSDILRTAMQSVDVCGAFVVVKTRPGFAGAVGREIESQAQELVLGTIAGEDTVLVIPRGNSLPELKQLLGA